MTDYPTISVCIPTHGRPDFLVQALESVVAQTLAPTEVVVSDDVGDASTAGAISSYRSRTSASIVHTICERGSGQAKNVNSAFLAASSELILLLHDDDLLYPEALKVLVCPFVDFPDLVASYGQQTVVSELGEELPAESQEVNRIYHRETSDGGLQRESLRAAILQQFPNDGYLIRASVAKSTLLDPKYGAGTDFEFGIRCALRGAFYFIPVRTAKYRVSAHSVLRGSGAKSDDSVYQFVRLCLDLLKRHPECGDALERRLKEGISAGIIQAAKLGHSHEALHWAFGRYHWAKLLTWKGWARAFWVVGALLMNYQCIRSGNRRRKVPIDEVAGE